MIGLYIHVPFCLSKCPYCDFYSLPLPDSSVIKAYTDEVCRRLETIALTDSADSLYFGGGTPSLLGGKYLSRIIQTARQVGLCDNAEITLEANPADSLYDTFSAFAAAGGNRLSMGMQSATAAGLSALGRRHTPDQLQAAVQDAQRAGIYNLSLDIMLATPSQTEAEIDAAVAVCREANADHVSAYLLKIEAGTSFYNQQHTLLLPDEDTAASLYLYACEALEYVGYYQYEISNFARKGYESRHNLKYWNGDPYIGIGPAAHSFIGGKRLYMPRSLEAFLRGAKPIRDTESSGSIGVNSAEEYAMLRLRLTEGVLFAAFEEKFQKPFPAAWIKAARRLPNHLITVSDKGLAFTREGFLLSNILISHILWGE